MLARRGGAGPPGRVLTSRICTGTAARRLTRRG